jgi:lipopolysaccharide/colanic/teichoic acid biosynthesis glycosyltransferase
MVAFMDGQHSIQALPIDTTYLPQVERSWSKRMFDVVLATLLIVVLTPLWLFVALAIVIASPGPVLYVQQRAGHRGRMFRMFKFRTMRRDRRVQHVPIAFPDRRRGVKVKDDPRITSIGRVLRRTSIDELPQLLNILHGEMSFVGPRPELPELVAHYSSVHHLRHLVVPGLTGWWQVNGRCSRPDGCGIDEDLAGKIADDLYYLRHQSVGLDLRILLLTVPVIVRGKGCL